MKRIGKRYHQGASCPYRPKPDRAVPLLEEGDAGVLPARGGGSSIGGKKGASEELQRKRADPVEDLPRKGGFPMKKKEFCIY